MNRYGQYCPVAAAVDVLGQRWTLLIVRDLLSGVCHFNDLSRGLPRMSRGLLAERLRHLQHAGIIERSEGEDGRTGYLLTEAGVALAPVVEALLNWGEAWAFEEPDPDELDPVLLMWLMRRRVCPERLPPERVVAQFDFHGHEASFWLVLARNDVSLCLKRPRFDVEMWVTADLAAFYRVWLGRQSLVGAVAGRSIQVRATPALEQAFPTWFAERPAASAGLSTAAARFGR